MQKQAAQSLTAMTMVTNGTQKLASTGQSASDAMKLEKISTQATGRLMKWGETTCIEKFTEKNVKSVKQA